MSGNEILRAKQDKFEVSSNGTATTESAQGQGNVEAGTGGAGWSSRLEGKRS